MKKNILHVTSVYFSLPYFIGNQFKYFIEKGFSEHVICSKSPLLRNYSEEMGFEYKETPILRRISPFWDIISIYCIVKYIKVNKINLINGHSPKGALLAMVAGYFCKVPKRIYFRHGLVFETSRGLKRKLLLLIDKLTSCLSTDIVCVSPSLFEASLENKLNSKTKQRLLNKGTCTGIDSIFKFNPQNIKIDKKIELMKEFDLNKDNFVIGYTGRLVVDKGIIELVEAFSKLNVANKKLLLVGMFDDRDTLPDSVIEEIKSNKDIIYTGYIDKDIEYYYSLMDIFVLASYREGFPTCVLEASSLEIPIVTTKKTGCIDSILENVTGFYSEINPEYLVNTIERLSDKDIRRQFGENGRKYVVKHFDERIVWKEIEKLYD
ncbi:MAG: glycosyltransferase [Marinifilaceae bacterium]|jgi:glycosyltransferase involved in cell wall biosynthesis|nr:glycosyltransferase [Marinifilaceae bacterium]